jgi:hypothetical protein
VTTQRKRKRSAARPAAPGHGFVLEQQPDDVTCGPACLHGVYRHYGDDLPLDRIIADIHTLDQGGTLDVFLANHAMQRGYAATILTYNLDVFDPTWFALPNDAIRERLAAQALVKPWSRLQIATRGYDEFLRLGGKLLLNDLDPKLLRRYLDRGPIITGLSATYLYRAVRDIPETNADDDVRGEPVGHFVVLTGHRRNAREILIADPHHANPLARTRYYAVQVQRLIGAILLGVMTYDANLLVIEPKRVRR